MLKPNQILRNDEPGEAGGGVAPAPIEAPAAAPVADAPAPAAEPEEAFSALKGALDAVGSAPNGDDSGPVRDAQGRFAPQTPTPTPAPTAAPVAGPAAPAAPIQPAPKPGEVDLSAPEGMAPRAQERWAQLTERAKQVPVLEQRVTEATTQLDSVRRMVADSGLAPAEFTAVLETNRLMRSQNPQDLQRAMQHLDAQRAELAGRLGIEVPGVDLLANHADLRTDVDGMLMTRERAIEIARLRDQTAQAGANRQQQQEHQQFVQTVNNAAAAMDHALSQRAGQPGHEAKVSFIKTRLSDPQQLQSFVSTYQPHQWQPALLMMYDAYTPPAAPLPVGPQPLRPGNTRAGGPVRSGPVTAESAVSGAFDRLGL